MYGFPKDLDIKGIIGLELNLLGLGRYDLQLNFTGSGIHICIQGPASLVENKKIIATWNDSDNWSSLQFQKILNATVEGYAVTNEHLLEIRFSKGLALQIHDDNEQYEVAQFYFEDKSLPTVVV